MQGGSEARHSNELLHHIISNAIDTVAPEIGSGLIALVNSRDEIRDLLKLDDVIDLVQHSASISLLTYFGSTRFQHMRHGMSLLHQHPLSDYKTSLPASW